MESIENIKSVYRRIEDEARCELNKVQQQIYRISTLRLLLFVAGIAGIIYFRTESWAVLTGIALVTLLPFILLIKYHNRLFHRKDYLEKKAFMSGCGLYVSWEKCINDIDYLEETFCFENDNVVFRCPWHKKNCEQNHPLLREDNFGFCACHMVSDYQYEKNTHSDSQFLKKTVNAMEKTEKFMEDTGMIENPVDVASLILDVE
mgnify:CR=1 FL=1